MKLCKRCKPHSQFENNQHVSRDVNGYFEPSSVNCCRDKVGNSSLPETSCCVKSFPAICSFPPHGCRKPTGVHNVTENVSIS